MSSDNDRQAHAAGTTEAITTPNGWTSDELFAETLKRRAGDFPALRAMQELTLRAQLAAHNGR